MRSRPTMGKTKAKATTWQRTKTVTVGDDNGSVLTLQDLLDFVDAAQSQDIPWHAKITASSSCGFLTRVTTIVIEEHKGEIIDGQ